MAKPYVREGSSVLDIGGYDGHFLKKIRGKIERGVCIDPLVEEENDGKIELIKYYVTDMLPFPNSSFDTVTMLAVLEHLDNSREHIVSEIYRVLKVGGIVILTVPNNAVDHILKVLIKLRLIDGMSFEEHGYFDSSKTIIIFEERGFRLRKWVKFQLGLNIFVFEK